MKYILALILFFFLAPISLAQQEEVEEVIADSLYKEDQFYFGVTYNLLGKMPDNMSQNSFSSGFHVGFIKDMPINTNRNWAVGLGLGYSTNSFNQNLFIDKDTDGNYVYDLISSEDFTKNKISQHLIELPLELRWRSSTPDTYKFWRIYTGFKIGYVFASTSKYVGANGTIKHKNIKDFDELQYGLTLGVGYNTWNGYVYYGLNPIFDSSAKLEGKSIDVNAIKIGLIFYML